MISKNINLDILTDGKMRNIETGEGFQFVVKEGDQVYNQRHYEALGEVSYCQNV